MKLVGRKRRLTDEQLRIVRNWKSLTELAREWNLPKSTVSHARCTTYKSERKRS